MYTYDLRESLLNRNDMIKNRFPLHFGGYELEIGMIYDTEGKLNINLSA